MISAKVKKQYTKIQNEKAAKSIKVLSGYVPTQGRGSSSYDTSSKFFILFFLLLLLLLLSARI